MTATSTLAGAVEPGTTDDTAKARRNWIGWVIAAACVATIVVYLFVALRRLGHPFDLEWLEGGSVEHVRRILAGRPIYTAPSVDFVGYTYPPLYFWVSAAVARVVGVGYLPLRLVSLAASLGTMVVLAAGVRREVGRWLPGLAAAAIFAGAFAVTGSWYDVGRVDSLFVLLLVLAVVLAVQASSWKQGAVAGLLLGLAVLTKQTAVIAGLPLGAYLLATRRKIGVPFLGVAAGVVGAVSLWLNATSHGWYRYGVVDELLGQPRAGRSSLTFWRTDIVSHLWPTSVLVGAAVLAGQFRGRRVAYVVAAAGMIAGAWLSRLHAGGAANVLIPAVAAIALVGGIAAGSLSGGTRLRAFVTGALLVQLGVLAYLPQRQIPRPDEVVAGRALVTALRHVPGDVLVFAHPSYAVFAGKPAHAQAVAIADVVRAGDRRARGLLEASLAQAIHDRRFTYVIFDRDEGRRGLPADFESYYRQVPAPYDNGTPPYPVGVRWWPSEWWSPR